VEKCCCQEQVFLISKFPERVSLRRNDVFKACLNARKFAMLTNVLEQTLKFNGCVDGTVSSSSPTHFHTKQRAPEIIETRRRGNEERRDRQTALRNNLCLCTKLLSKCDLIQQNKNAIIPCCRHTCNAVSREWLL